MDTCELEKPVENMDPRELCLYIDSLTPEGGLYTDVQRPVHARSNSAWRVSPEPWGLPAEIVEQFEAMGRHLQVQPRGHRFVHGFCGFYAGLQQTKCALEFLDLG